MDRTQETTNLFKSAPIWERVVFWGFVLVVDLPPLFPLVPLVPPPNLLGTNASVNTRASSLNLQQLRVGRQVPCAHTKSSITLFLTFVNFSQLLLCIVWIILEKTLNGTKRLTTDDHSSYLFLICNHGNDSIIFAHMVLSLVSFPGSFPTASVCTSGMEWGFTSGTLNLNFRFITFMQLSWISSQQEHIRMGAE